MLVLIILDTMTTMPVSQLPLSSIAIVGGGAAGFFTAITLAEKIPGLQITIFEASPNPLQKVRISGGGRCNLTHACFDFKQLATHYPRGEKSLLGLFSRFQPQDTIAWFQSRGLALKTEDDGRVFPNSDSSESVIQLLMALVRKNGITLASSSRITNIQHQDNRFCLTVQTVHGSRSAYFDACVLATGYSPPGWKLAKGLGHPLQTVVPSLFPFKTSSSLLDGLQGLTLLRVQGTLTTKPSLSESGLSTKKLKKSTVKAEGALLVTHSGVSGPLVYRLSAWGARMLAENNYQGTLLIDCLPNMTVEELYDTIQTMFAEQRQKKALNTRLPEIPNRLWYAFLEAVGIRLDNKVEAVTKRQQRLLAEKIKALPLTVIGKNPSKEEFVSCGGVELKYVDFKRMESRLVPNLFFAGEILDIDGLTGGFNFQACWSAAWTISETLLHQK